MRNISLVSIPCESDTLCGISSRFQLLSPTHRQVIHALLTRPPLSKAPEGACSVRLECVMHAASVHPEPGSNSRMFCIKSRSVRVSNLYPSFCLFALYFFELRFFIASKGFVEIPKLSFRTSYNFNCCSIFKDHFCRLTNRLVDSLFIIPPFSYFVNTFFEFFSSSFFISSRRSSKNLEFSPFFQKIVQGNFYFPTQKL